MVTAWRWLLARRGGPARSRRVHRQRRPAGRRDTHGRWPGRVLLRGAGRPPGLSAVRHVWVIELENQRYAQSLGTPSADPYLAKTLPRMGARLENYYAIGHASADNYVA
jgi:hypothetical protein